MRNIPLSKCEKGAESPTENGNRFHHQSRWIAESLFAAILRDLEKEKEQAAVVLQVLVQSIAFMSIWNQDIPWSFLL